MSQSDENPIEQLVDLFIYAPIGLLYEHQEILPQLVKRGKSQVQLARVLGQMALRQRPRSLEQQLQAPAETLIAVLAEAITEVGSHFGLAPPRSDDGAGPSAPDQPAPATAHGGSEDSDEPAQLAPAGAPDSAAEPAVSATPRLPIARYDELTAREIVGLLADLTDSQLERVRHHEQANRARKTVLAKVDQLLGH